jgi:hypothetical protein
MTCSFSLFCRYYIAVDKTVADVAADAAAVAVAAAE